MISTRYVSHTYDLDPALIRTFSSLTHKHARAITEAIEAGAPDWEVDLLDDYNGYLSVLVSMKDEAEGQPSYLISGMAQQIELAEVRDDTLRELGRFDTAEQVIDALVAELNPNSV